MPPFFHVYWFALGCYNLLVSSRQRELKQVHTGDGQVGNSHLEQLGAVKRWQLEPTKYLGLGQNVTASLTVASGPKGGCGGVGGVKVIHP